VFRSTPRPHFNPRKDPVPIVQEILVKYKAKLKKHEGYLYKDGSLQKEEGTMRIFSLAFQSFLQKECF